MEWANETCGDPAEIVYRPDEKASRRWQGCPSIEITPGGTLYAAWYTGGTHEPQPENYCVIARSRDGGASYEDPFCVLRMSAELSARPLDAELFCDPAGRLWIFWGESLLGGDTAPVPYHDGVFGVWATVCENPDDVSPVFDAPRRLADGFLRNKPLVRRNGEWAMCAYDWISPDYAYYTSGDQGQTWQRQTGPQKLAGYRPMPDETMLVEKMDGTLWLLARTRRGVAQSFGGTQGAPWTPLQDAAFPGPNSRFYIGRLASGALLMVNHAGFTGRSHLTAMLSTDDGKTWPHALLLDARPNVSYPDVAQGADGTLYIIYDRERTGAGEILVARCREEDIIAGGERRGAVISSIRPRGKGHDNAAG